MSNYWDILCKDCDAHFGIDNANNSQKLLRAVISYRSAIAEIGKINNPDIWDVEFRVNNHTIKPEMFAKHAGHNLVAVDEYGRQDDECGAFIECKCCNTSKNCKLKVGHTGEHEIVVKEFAVVNAEQTDKG